MQVTGRPFQEFLEMLVWQPIAFSETDVKTITAIAHRVPSAEVAAQENISLRAIEKRRSKLFQLTGTKDERGFMDWAKEKGFWFLKNIYAKKDPESKN